LGIADSEPVEKKNERSFSIPFGYNCQAFSGEGHVTPQPDSPAGRPPAYRWVIETLLFASYFVFGMSWIGYAPFLAAFQQELALSHGEAGMLISAVSFAKTFAPFLAGWLAVRMGVKRAILLGMAFMCASLASPYLADAASLIASRFVFGIGGAILVTLFGAAVLQWFPPRERPLLNGVNGVAVNAGITLTLFLTPPLAARIGRTSALSAYAVISLLLTLAWAVFGRNRNAGGPAAATQQQESYIEVLGRRETWLLAFGFSGPLALYLVFNTWLPTYYQQALGMSLARGAQLTGLANLVGIPAAIAGGMLVRRFPARKPFIWGSAIVITLAAFGMFLASDPAEISVWAVMFGVSLFLWVSPLVTLAMELPGMTPARFAMVMGVFFGASYVAAFFAPILAGMLRDSTGSFLPGFALFSASCVSLLIAGLLLPETGKRRAEEA
jgi:cyanate permease